eukprot:4781393-Prymnesium_polylepis.1
MSEGGAKAVMAAAAEPSGHACTVAAVSPRIHSGVVGRSCGLDLERRGADIDGASVHDCSLQIAFAHCAISGTTA